MSYEITSSLLIVKFRVQVMQQAEGVLKRDQNHLLVSYFLRRAMLIYSLLITSMVSSRRRSFLLLNLIRPPMLQ